MKELGKNLRKPQVVNSVVNCQPLAVVSAYMIAEGMGIGLCLSPAVVLLKLELGWMCIRFKESGGNYCSSGCLFYSELVTVQCY